MFDLLSMATLTAGAAVVVLLLSSLLSETPRQRSFVAAALVAWFAIVLAAGATGAFSIQTGIGVPGVGLGVVIPLSLLAVIAFGTQRGRDLVRRVPLATLTGVHSLRVLGILFVLLYAAKRLPAPFAPVAGWGDVVVGLMAIPLTIRLVRGKGQIPRALLFAWNALGLLDLVTAVALGATSSPGPAQIFHGEPSAAIMASLPWILIPCFLVPALAFVHLCSFYRLRIMQPDESRVHASPARVAAAGL